jgi:N-formylglutamate deformylase
MQLHQGSQPLVISFPHSGRALPAEVAARMTEVGRAVTDTDWHVERLYAFAKAMGVSWIEPTCSRYVVDLNRPPDDAALYAGQVSTGLCPTHTFAGEALYLGATPDATEVALRRAQYWQPYHDGLQDLLAQAQARHGFAVLLDAHSIRSVVPRLFDGRLPDINVGTYGGLSCDPMLQAQVMAVLAQNPLFTHVLNGRFQGGYITRHYGNPQARVYALQIELSQLAYMDEATVAFDEYRATPLMGLLKQVVAELLQFCPA